MQLPESKEIYRKRSGVVEARFGNLKTKGMRFVRLRRLKNNNCLQEPDRTASSCPGSLFFN